MSKVVGHVAVYAKHSASMIGPEAHHRPALSYRGRRRLHHTKEHAVIATAADVSCTQADREQRAVLQAADSIVRSDVKQAGNSCHATFRRQELKAPCLWRMQQVCLIPDVGQHAPCGVQPLALECSEFVAPQSGCTSAGFNQSVVSKMCLSLMKQHTTAKGATTT